MQNRNGYEGGDVKPDRHIKVSFATLDDGHHHVYTEDYPNKCNGNIDRPFQFSVFFRGGNTKRQCQRSRYDNKLPSPEINFRKCITPHSGFE